MTKEQVIKNRETFGKFGPYKLFLDNEVMFVSGVNKRAVIYDDENELVYEISANTDQYHSKTDKEIKCSGYDTIQYFMGYSTDKQYNDFLQELKSDNVLSSEEVDKIIDNFKFK